MLYDIFHVAFDIRIAKAIIIISRPPPKVGAMLRIVFVYALIIVILDEFVFSLLPRHLIIKLISGTEPAVINTIAVDLIIIVIIT